MGYGNTLYYTSEIGPAGNDGEDGNGIVSATNNGNGTLPSLLMMELHLQLMI